MIEDIILIIVVVIATPIYPNNLIKIILEIIFIIIEITFIITLTLTFLKLYVILEQGILNVDEKKNPITKMINGKIASIYCCPKRILNIILEPIINPKDKIL